MFSACEGKPTEFADQLKCSDGELADKWDGCVDRGSKRVQCPYPFIPCNQLKSNGEFKCGRSCSSFGGKRTDCTDGKTSEVILNVW